MNQSRQSVTASLSIFAGTFLTIGMLLSASAAQAQGLSPAALRAAGGDAVMAAHLDGRIVNIKHLYSGTYLAQGYEGLRDDHRAVETQPNHDAPNLPPRMRGHDWVFETTTPGYWRIINVTSGLYLTAPEEGGVNNWGRSQELDQAQQWKITENTSLDPVFQRGGPVFRITNRKTGLVLTVNEFDENGQEDESVDTRPIATSNPRGYDWVITPAAVLQNEQMFRNTAARGVFNPNMPVESLASLRRLTIESVKAVKVSTGQDGATKVLFAGIDLAVDVGMGIVSGGATAAGKTAAKYGGRALAKESLQAAAKAGAQAAARKAGRNQIVKDVAKGQATDYAKKEACQWADANDVTPDVAAQFANLSLDVLDALSSESLFNTFSGGDPDDLDIQVNGVSIFPNGGRDNGRKIESQQTLAVGKSVVFERMRGVKIELVEYDSGSDDDSLGYVIWRPEYTGGDEDSFKEFGQITISPITSGKLVRYKGDILVDGVERYKDIIITKESEGSLYEITYRIEPFVPADMIGGILERPSVRAIHQAVDRQNALAARNRKIAEDAARKAAEQAQLEADRARDRAVKGARMERAEAGHANCSLRGDMRSPIPGPGAAAETISFWNIGSSVVRVYWINNQGQETNWASQAQPLHTLQPGKSATEPATTDSYFIAIDANNECVGIGRPVDNDRQMAFNPDMNMKYSVGMPSEDPVAPPARPPASPFVPPVAAPPPPIPSQGASAAAKTSFQNCSLRRIARSPDDDGRGPVEVLLINEGSAALNIFWIDSKGQEVNMANSPEPLLRLPGGQSSNIRWNPGNLFIAANDAGQCAGIAPSSAQDKNLIFSADLIQTGSAAPPPPRAQENPPAQPAPPPGAAGCDQIGQLVSRDGGALTTVRFNNAGQSPILVFWLNEAGQPMNYNRQQQAVVTIPARSFQDVRTKVGHILVAADQNVQCVGIAVVSSQATNQFTFAAH